MAGEIEEHFSISLLAESVHCGSISFGRFANEPLAWERKSSFKRNRYLEEVEKFAKSGSVIEKKAYFEAYFRKKALLLSSSSTGQNGTEDRTCESDAMENEDYRQYQSGENCAAESIGYGDDSGSTSQGSHNNEFDENGLSSADYGEGFYCGNEGSLFDHENKSSICAQFDMSQEGSEYLGEGILIECARQFSELLSANETRHVSVPIDVEHEEISHVCAESSISTDNPEKEVEENLDGDKVNIDESLSLEWDLAPNSGTTGEVNSTNSEIEQGHSQKLKPAIENKASKPRLKSSTSPDHSQKNSFCDPSKVAARILERKEKEKRTKEEKLPLQTASCSMHKSPIQEDSTRCNAKLTIENKSLKGSTKKVMEAQPSSHKKIEPVARQIPNKVKQTLSSTREDAKSNTRRFCFKSQERAENRKEEKTEVAIKQSRKSLNFKAKPMPSFYHVSTTSGSTGNKTATSTMKTTNVRQKSANFGTRAVPKSPPRSMETNKQALSVAGLNCPTVKSSQVGTVSSTPPTDGHRSPEPVTRNAILSKKDREKENSNLQNHRISESSKAVKDHKFSGRPKVVDRRSYGGLVTKNMKNTGIISSSGIGRLAVMAS